MLRFSCQYISPARVNRRTGNNGNSLSDVRCIEDFFLIIQESLKNNLGSVKIHAQLNHVSDLSFKSIPANTEG